MLAAIRDWYRSLTDIKREEWAPTALMFLYGFLALTSYYVVKPARNSVFVDRVGADNLPYVYILTAVVVSVVMWFYSRYVERLKELTLLLCTFALLAVNLVGFWWWLRMSEGVVSSGTFYIWGKLYPLLLVSQFYLVGNLIFTTHQARRLFGFIGVGLILGGIAGSSVSGWAATAVGTENLLLVAAGLLGLCALLVLALASRMREGSEASGRLMEDVSGDAFRLLRESSHLRTIAAILGLTIVVGTLIDWQFNSAVERAFASEDAKTAFFGRFFLGLNLASVLIQVFLTGFVLRRFGVGLAMLVLPLGLLVASVGVLALPALLTAVLAKGTEGGLRYSLDQSTRELLYLPVPSEVKYKVKPLIDLAVYRGGTGLGGVLLILMVNVFGLPWEVQARLVAGTAVLCIGFWIAATVRMRGEFRGSIRRLIGVQDVDLDELIVQRVGAEAVEEALRAMEEGDEEEVLFALSLFERFPEGCPDCDVLPLLNHESPRVRERALAVLRELGAGSHIDRVRALLDDPSLDVRVEAIYYLCAFEGGDAAEVMGRYLTDEDEEVRIAATACVLRHGGEEQVTRMERTVEEMAEAADPATRADAARLLGSRAGPSERGERILERLVDDEAAEVRAVALRAAGKAKGWSLLPELVERLADREEREAAREGLAAFGREAHDRLLDLLRNADLDPGVRRQLPSLLYREADQSTVDRLFERLAELEPEVCFECLKTLNKLHRDREDLDFERYEIDPLLEREIRSAYAAAARHVALEEAGRDGLLGRLLEQRREEAIERATRLLGLHHGQADLYAAFEALASRDPVRRQQGYELLDNSLPRRYARLFDPLANPDRSPRDLARSAAERLDIRPGDDGSVLRELAGEEDGLAAELARRELSDTREGGREKMDIVERAELLGKTEIFGSLRVEDLMGIAALVEEREYGEGEILFETGGTGTQLFIVVEGVVEARRGDRALFTAEPGESVGDLSLLDGRTRNYDARAARPARVLVLGREEFFDLMEDRFRIVQGLVGHLSGIIRRLNEAVGSERLPRADDEEARV